jgi:hypothetical protein
LYSGSGADDSPGGSGSSTRWTDGSQSVAPRTAAKLGIGVGERSLLRTVWEDPHDRESRSLIDVIECASATDASEAQADRLAANQLARLLEGPPDLGLASFTRPPKRRRRPCFSRGGLGDEAFLKFFIFGGNVIRREGRLRSAPKRLDATSE